MQNKNSLMTQIKALGKKCIFTGNVASMRASYKAAVEKSVDTGQTDSAVSLNLNRVGTRMIGVNGIQCFVHYEVDFEQRACKLELHHKLKPQPTCYTLQNITKQFDIEACLASL